MRTSLVALIGAAVLGLMGCSGNTAVAPHQDLSNFDNQVSIDPVTGQTTSLAGAFHIDFDLAARTAEVTPILPRSGQVIGDLYFLNVANFGVKLGLPTPPQQTLTNPTATTIDFHYSVTHSFPTPPTPGGTASASNRADLGISGRVVFLKDAPVTVDDPSSWYHEDDFTFTFGTDNVTLHSKACLNADGYYDPKGMLLGPLAYIHTPTNGTNAWPFKALVDESLDPRTNTVTGAPIPNAGDSRGNYLSTHWATLAAWTGGPNVTGYGVLHQGQTADNFITVSLEPEAGIFPVGAAAVVIATYTDPRFGTTTNQKRANRLPRGVTGDDSLFAYRMPHGATDIENISIGNLSGTLGSVPSGLFITADVTVVDQDFATTVFPAPTPPAAAPLETIPNLSDFSAIELAAGELGATAQDPVTATPTGLGSVEFPVTYAGVVITNIDGVTGGVDAGAYVAVRITDRQDLAAPGLEQGLTFNNDTPVPGQITSGDEQHPIVVQVVFVDIV